MIDKSKKTNISNYKYQIILTFIITVVYCTFVFAPWKSIEYAVVSFVAVLITNIIIIYLLAKFNNAIEANYSFETSKNWQFIVLVVAVIVSLILIIIKIIELDIYAPFTDEVGTLSSMQNFIYEGIPRVGPTLDSINYEPLDYRQIYWAYFPEIILRLPFYILFENTGNMMLAVLAPYCYAIIIAIIAMLFLRKSNKKEICIILSIFLILLFSTPWIAETFHYVRYYAFLLISFILSLFVCSWLFSLKEKLLKHYIIALVIGIMPLIFHQSYIVSCASIFAYIIFDIFFGKNENKVIDKRLKLISIILVIVAAVGILAIPAFRNNIAYYFTNFKISDLIIMGQMLFANSLWQLILTISLFTILIMRYRSLSTFTKTSLKLSVFFMLGFIFLALFAEDKMINQRYQILPYTVWIYIVTLGILELGKILFSCINAKIGKQSLKICIYTLIICGICSAYALVYYPLRNYNERMSLERMEKIQIDRIKKEIAEHNAKGEEVILISTRGFNELYHFPDTRIYSMRIIPSPIIKEENAVNVVYFETKEGEVKNIYGETFFSSAKNYVEVLESIENPQSTYLYFLIVHNYPDETLTQFFANNLDLVGKRTVAEHLEAIKQDNAMNVFLSGS